MKIVLLGKKGMLGNQFFEKLQSLKAGQGNNVEIFSFDHSELDVVDVENLDRVMTKISPDIVINCIAYTNVDLAETDRENAYILNAKIPTELAKILKKLDSILIHFSTDYVFDGKKPLFEGYFEDETANPVNYYGLSKLQGEEGITTNMEKYYIFRTSWLYGPRFENRGKNFVDKMLKMGQEVIEGKREKLDIVNDQFGSPTLTSDLVQSVVNNIINKYNFGSIIPFGIYHQTNSGVTNWHEFAVKIFEFAKMDIFLGKTSSDKYLTPAKRPLNSILINSKIPKLRDWEDALKDYIYKTKF